MLNHEHHILYLSFTIVIIPTLKLPLYSCQLDILNNLFHLNLISQKHEIIFFYKFHILYFDQWNALYNNLVTYVKTYTLNPILSKQALCPYLYILYLTLNNLVHLNLISKHEIVNYFNFISYTLTNPISCIQFKYIC
jgi:hypothetical protein